MSTRFETKAGAGSGAGYERWRSYELRPSTPTPGAGRVSEVSADD